LLDGMRRASLTYHSVVLMAVISAAPFGRRPR
jgi:hypothetical protein